MKKNSLILGKETVLRTNPESGGMMTTIVIINATLFCPTVICTVGCSPMQPTCLGCVN